MHAKLESMKPTTAIRAILFILACALPASAQVSRLNFASTTTNPQCAPGAACPLLAIPGSTVQICTAIVGCPLATSYTDSTGTTACPAFSQVTLSGSPACVSATSAQDGSGGAWLTSGTYYVYFTSQFGSVGPLPYSVGGGGGGGGNCPVGPTGSVQFSNGASCAGSANLIYAGQALTSIGSGGNPAFIAQGGTFQSQAGSYDGFNSSTDGIYVPGYAVQPTTSGAPAGGYIALTPVTYNPYNQPGTCLDQFGNPVQQPLPLTGYAFQQYVSVLWVAASPELPPAPTAGCPTPGGPPLPVNPNNALYGLNTNSYFFARGGLATDDNAYNSIQSLLGGIYVKLGVTAGQALYPQSQTSCSALNTPGAGFGGFGYLSVNTYCYWNGTTWNPFNFASGGGTGCVVSAPNLSILYSTGTPSFNCNGTANAAVDANGNLSLAGSGSVLAINGATGGLNVTADGAYDSVQTVGGYLSALSVATNAGLTIVGATSQSKNLAEFYSHTPTLLASVSAAGAGLFAGMTLSNLGGVAQCLQANILNVVSGTGSPCGGSGGSPGSPTNGVQVNVGGVFGAFSSMTYVSNLLTLISPNTPTSYVLQLESNMAGQEAGMVFSDAGTQKWAWAKNADNSFSVYGNTAGISIINIPDSAGANLALTPPSGTVLVNGKASTAGIDITTGFGQADGGFIATTGTCNLYNCIQAQTGGVLGRNLTALSYLSMASASPSPTSESWASGPGVFWFNSSGSPTFYFQSGTGASTTVAANVNANSITSTSTTQSFGAAGYYTSSATGANPTFTNANGCYLMNGNGVETLGCSGSGLDVSTSTASNGIQIPNGGMLAGLGVTVGQGLYPFGRTCSTFNIPASGYGGLAFQSGSTYCFYNVTAAAWQTWTPGSGGGGGVTSLNGLTGVLSIAGTANEITVTPSGTTISLATPQPIGLTTNFAANSYTSGCGAAGSNQYAFTSCSTTSAIAFSTNNNNFEVDGLGNVSAATQFNTPGVYKTNGTTVIDSGRNATFTSLSASSTLFVSGISTLTGVSTLLAGAIMAGTPPTTGAGAIGFGGLTAAPSNCISLATGCVEVNVAGTLRYVPYY
jgi:hypothetical protein